MASMKSAVRSLANDIKGVMAPLVKDNKNVKKFLVDSGAALGGLAGPLGSAAGVHFARRISKLIGSGDYSVNQVRVNSLINPAGADPVASFQAAGGANCLRIRHREFLGDVTTGGVAGQFTNYSYPINVGLRETFPFLSQVADNYEEYVMGGLVFEFISTASPYLATSALGSIIASMEYNPTAPPFTSKYQMENSANAVSNRLDKSIMYGVECAHGVNPQNSYFIRTGASAAPLTSTDMGTFQIAVAPGNGVPTNSVVGELWVTYDVCLDRPVLNANRPGVVRLTRGTVSTTNIFGSTQSTTNYSSGILSGTTVTGTVITLPSTLVPGDVIRVTNYWSGTAGAVSIGAFGLVGLTLLNAWANNSASQEVGPAASVTSAAAILDTWLQVTSVKGPYTITANATNTGPLSGTTATDITITSYGNAVVGSAPW